MMPDIIAENNGYEKYDVPLQPGILKQVGTRYSKFRS